jgi:hypothetical protein
MHQVANSMTDEWLTIGMKAEKTELLDTNSLTDNWSYKNARESDIYALILT